MRGWSWLTALGLLLLPAVASLPSVAAQPPYRALAAVVAQGPVSSAQPEINVVLLGWDGAQREHLRQCLERNELPNLAQLGRDGALVDIDILEQTDTKAGWTQILTGYNAEVTGVFDNMHYRPIPPGYTIFERLEAYYGADAICTWAVIGKKGNVGHAAPQRFKLNSKGLPEGVKRKKRQRQLLNQGTVVVEGEASYLDIPGEPYFLAQHNMDHFENGLGGNDKVGERALAMLEQTAAQPFFAFIHFADVDHQGHKFGENSQEYTAALISCDLWLGQIRGKLGELGLAERTVIYVTADHGFDEDKHQHKDAPYVFLATNDQAVVHSGKRVDITPTILARYGIDQAELTPVLDGRSLR